MSRKQLIDIIRIIPYHKKCIFTKKGNSKWIYISYIVEPFFRGKSEMPFFSVHQNRNEIIVIKEVMLDLGYNVYIEKFDYPFSKTKISFDIVFGLEFNFEKVCANNPNSLKIYYATGAYYEYQNKIIEERTNEFCVNHNYKVNIQRRVIKHSSSEIADKIIQIGSHFTIDTYPKALQKKICLLNQSSNLTVKCDIKKKLFESSRNQFIWMGGGGSILKGLDMVIDYFNATPNYIVNIVGDVDSDVFNYYKNIGLSSNIIFHGFLDVNSDRFSDIVYKCAFQIYPSGSEGCPGSVISLMKLGVIPILSKWASFDEISDYGYMLDSISLAAIDKAINWSKLLTDLQFENLVMKNIKFAEERWNLYRFKDEFKSIIEAEIGKYIK